MKKSTCAAVLASVALYLSAMTVDAAPAHGWEGLYLGGQVGYGLGSSSTEGFYYDQVAYEENYLFGGVYGGYNVRLKNNIVLGAEVDLSFSRPEYLKTLYAEDAFSEFTRAETTLSGAVRARVGYAFEDFLPYFAVGLAAVSFESVYGYSDPLERTGKTGYEMSQKKTHAGWTAGIGVDYAATESMTVRFEYRYTDYGSESYDYGFEMGDNMREKLESHDVRLGIAYMF